MSAGFEPHPELNDVCNELWNADENCCWPGEEEDYVIDIQGYVTSTRDMSIDRARTTLFTKVDEEKVFAKPTYEAFRALLDNYEIETGEQETVTKEEFKENVFFIDLIMETPCMKICFNHLVSKEKVPDDLNEFKKLLYRIWFTPYRRTKFDKDFDSSGFEHVFVGENKQGKVIGFHNWIQLYLQEKRGNIDYRGHFRRGTSDEESPRMLTCQFTWNKSTAKPIGSTFVGTSPEFEFALYSLIHIIDLGDEINLLLGGYEIEIHCFPFGREAIGTAYPESHCS